MHSPGSLKREGSGKPVDSDFDAVCGHVLF